MPKGFKHHASTTARAKMVVGPLHGEADAPSAKFAESVKPVNTSPAPSITASAISLRVL